MKEVLERLGGRPKRGFHGVSEEVSVGGVGGSGSTSKSPKLRTMEELKKLVPRKEVPKGVAPRMGSEEAREGSNAPILMA